MQGRIAFQDRAEDAAIFVAVVIWNSAMLRAAFIPEYDVAWLPFMDICEFRF